MPYLHFHEYLSPTSETTTQTIIDLRGANGVLAREMGVGRVALTVKMQDREIVHNIAATMAAVSAALDQMHSNVGYIPMPV